MDDLLKIREDEDAYFVVLQRDETDWLVRFDKAEDFAAREWAENMVEAYNERFLNPDSEDQRWASRPPEVLAAAYRRQAEA